MTKTKSIEFLKVAGGFACLSGYMGFLTFSSRIPVILMWMSNDMLAVTAIGCAFLCVLCLIYPALFAVQFVVNKIIGVPDVVDWEEELKVNLKKGKK
ncbi:hypothetical protein [Enterobacter hormaechei]|uniref:hypothetical protein n=1 Tax=Enterobacter hormaechei TaxID=158836 RepID=UPI0029DDF604|nr:hypothetical protein [Enterobacter hormaechei]MDX7122040.1 hypothetical protein [Enterobacter hormaechei]